MSRYFAAILAATVTIVAIVAPAQAATTQAQHQHFQIAAGDLGQALDAYIHQSGRQLIYRVDDVRGVHSPGVQGDMSADEALAAIPTVGFVSHVDAAAIDAARRAGVGEVLARSTFTERLPDILQRGS